jgi:hypothetical protein
MATPSNKASEQKTLKSPKVFVLTSRATLAGIAIQLQGKAPTGRSMC